MDYDQVAKRDPEKLVKQIKSGELAPGQLTYAAESLGKISFDLAFPVLKELLIHSSSLVREGAVYGLSYFKQSEVVELLKCALKFEQSLGVCSAIEEVLEVLEEEK